jgi:uncharacterized protein YndB with AHSA1/START domain
MKVIQKTIEIKASPDKVWRVFTDPNVSREKMAGEYITDWQEGSSLGWKGADGKMRTNGKIIDIINGKLLKHSLFSPKDNTSVTSVVTYAFLYNNNGHTTLSASEDLIQDITDKEYEDASEGWNTALLAVKEAAEKL